MTKRPPISVGISTSPHKQLPEALPHVINQLWQLIEAVNRQLTDQFNVERKRTHTFYGLGARLYTMLTEHTLYVYLTRLLGKTYVLHAKVIPIVKTTKWEK